MNGTTESSLIARIAGINPSRVINAAYTALRGVIRIFLPFMRADLMLVLVQRAVLDETEQALKTENPDTDLSLSILALKSGLSTRMIKKVREDTPEISVLDICAEAALLAQWVRDPKLRDAMTGKPKELPLYGNTGTFQGLVSSHFGRGIAPTVVAEKLEKSGNVVVRDRSWVQLIHPDWRWINKEEGELLENAGNVIDSITSTLAHNHENRGNPDLKRVERRVFSRPVSESAACLAAKEINQLLLAQKDKLHQVIAKYEKLSEGNIKRSEKLKVIGAGYYLFEEEEDEQSKDNDHS